MTLEELNDRAVVVAAMRQARFAAAIGDRIWWVDPQNSVARLFTRAREPASDQMPIRILGTEGDGEWLWTWANALNFPLPTSRDYSNQLQALGKELGIAELTTPRLPLDGVVGAQTFATIALAMAGNAGYVLHRAGRLTAAFVVGAPFITADSTDFLELGQAIADVLGGARPYANPFDVIVGAFATLGVAHEIEGEIVTARDAAGGTITIGLEDGKFTCDVQDPGC